MKCRKNGVRKRSQKLLVSLLCAGMIFSDSSLGVLASMAAETSVMESGTNAEKNISVEDGENDFAGDTDAGNGSAGAVDTDTDGENDSAADTDMDGGNGSTEGTDAGDIDAGNDSAGDIDADGENDSAGDIDADGENDSAGDIDADGEIVSDVDEESNSEEDSGTDEENSDIEDGDICETNNSVEDNPETVRQSDDIEMQTDENETTPLVKFEARDVYYFNAIVDVYVYNCTDSHRDFDIVIQNTSDGSEPEKIQIDNFHVASLAEYDMNLRLYFDDLKAGSIYKMWCRAEGVNQQEFTFETKSFSDISVKISTKTYVCGVDIYIESSIPVPQSKYDWPVWYYRKKGETEWTYQNSNASEKIDDNTFVYHSKSLYTETEYEYMVEWTFERGLSGSEIFLFVKDQIINGREYFNNENYNDYEYETFTTKSIESAVALITDMKLTNGGVGNTKYTVTVSELDETVMWSFVYRQQPSNMGMGSGTTGWREDGWIELDGGGYSLTFVLDFLKENQTYEYDFSVTANNKAEYMVFVDNGKFKISGSGSSSNVSTGTKTLTKDMFSIDWDKAKVTGSRTETYGGSITYTGKAVKPKVTKKVTGITYKVSYKDNKNAGTARIIITGTKKCSGSLVYLFTIKPVELQNASDIKVKATPKRYTGNPNSPKFTVKYKRKALKLDKDYKITNLRGSIVNTTYNYNSKTLKTTTYSAQDYTYTVEGINNYKGTLYSGTFTVKPCSLKKVKITLTQDRALMITVKVGKSVQSKTQYDVIETKLISSKGKTKKYRVTIDLSKDTNVETTDKKHTVTRTCIVK